jgi:hypothetical protein
MKRPRSQPSPESADTLSEDLPANMALTYRAIGWSYAVVCAALAFNARPPARVRQRTATPTPAPRVVRPRVAPPPAVPTPSSSADASEWFRRVKPYCNTVEVSNVQRDMPAPKTVDGAGFNAACLALAGRIDDARRAIDALSDSDRARAAEIVFEIGHPVADAGDDRSAGPIMELVVDYIPNHYMALYHAGMAEYMVGQRDLSRRNLTEFLRYYSPEDGWRHNAKEILGRLDNPATASADPRRPREP